MQPQTNLKILTTNESWPLLKPFNISRGSKNNAEVIVVSISDDKVIGKAECVPYNRYGETITSVQKEINTFIINNQSNINSKTILEQLKPGAARNALDCAYIDYLCKKQTKTVYKMFNLNKIEYCTTTFTISVNTPERMSQEAKEANKYSLLKLKMGKNAENDIKAIELIKKNRPDVRLIIDANEGWHQKDIKKIFATCEKYEVELIEQPLPTDQDDILSDLKPSFIVCADESFHSESDFDKTKGKYNGVNIKLDKTGGFSTALKLVKIAKQKDLSVMLGCMVGTSLAMAPILTLAAYADFVDLDGPLLLKQDRENKIIFKEDKIYSPVSNVWG